jgi:hypothetical protein
MEAAQFAAALEGSALGVMMRESDWLYPVANLMHLLGLVLLLGAMLFLDLRLLGLARHVPLGTGILADRLRIHRPADPTSQRPGPVRRRRHGLDRQPAAADQADPGAFGYQQCRAVPLAIFAGAAPLADRAPVGQGAGRSVSVSLADGNGRRTTTRVLLKYYRFMALGKKTPLSAIPAIMPFSVRFHLLAHRVMHNIRGKRQA